MDDPIFQEKYQKYKYNIKLWEIDFKKKHKRIPSKHDIREAPNKIRYSYKMYYKMKTSILEDTLGEVLSDDGFDLDMSQDETNFTTLSSSLGVSQLTGTEEIPTKFSNIDDIQKSNELTKTVLKHDGIVKDFEPIETLEINKNAWNDSVSNQNKKLEQKIKQTPKDKFKTNLNLKYSPSFSIRNPRKSLSSSSQSKLSKSSSNLSLNRSDSKELLPDLETILAERSQKQNETITSNLLSKSSNISFEIDKGWLNRLDNDGGNNSKINISKEETNTSKTFGLSNLNFKNIQRNSIENISERNMNETKTVSISNVNLQNTQTTFTENIDTQSIPERNLKETVTSSQKLGENDSDSVVSNSEDESPVRRINTVRHIVKRRRIDDDISKSDNLDIIENENVIVSEQTNSVIENPSETKEIKSKTTKSKATKTKATKSKATKNPNPEAKKTKRQRKKKVKNSYDESNSSENEIENVKISKKKPRKPSVKKSVVPKEKPVLKKIPRTTRSSRKIVPEQAEEDTTVDQKYEMPLDFGPIKSLPRSNLEDLNQAETVLKDYVQKYSVPCIKKPIENVSEKQTKQNLAKEKLQDKITSGKLNENFVRININKKVFVRGKKYQSYSKYKKKLWKQKKAAALAGPEMDMGGCDGGIITCFECGQPGHFARNCKIKGDHLLPVDVVVDDSPFPTLKEAEEMANSQALRAHNGNIENLPKATNSLLYNETEESEEENVENQSEKLEEVSLKKDQNEIFIGQPIPEDILIKSGVLDPEKMSQDQVKPLYDLNKDGSIIETPEEVHEVLRMFGHTDFRKGQDRAIMRILSGKSTLVTLSTGSGKSLCYQLPAYLYSHKKKWITLVISPLVSLMEDQVHGVPGFLRAHCLHTNQTPQQKQNVMSLIEAGEVDILLLSPEAVVAGERSTGFGSLLRKLPPIAFACIDEAHCVSQWSHNFRPSYLMICKVLTQKLGVKIILGLTATATLPTRKSIIQHLGITDGMNGIITDIPLPDNLILSVSKDENRDHALITLLRSERFDSCQSIIIYCTRRDECERISGFIRTCLQDKKPMETTTKKRKRINWHAEPYHAGMPSSRRRTIQNAFMKNELRIVVATIAFGMGINKPDIRAIIHYNMPRNFESYVQEVGRSGRDGKIALCHLFLDSKGSDDNELRRHIYANSIDRHVIRKLLRNVFTPCSCSLNLKQEKFVNEYAKELSAIKDIDWDEDFNEDCNKIERKRICPGHEIGFSIETTVKNLDIPEENISTLLCYLELAGKWSIQVMSNAYVMCKVISYGGAKYLKQAAQQCPPLAMGIAIELKKKTFDEEANILEFSVIEIAAAIGWNSGIVKYQLKNLEWTNINGLPKRTSISVNFYNLGFRLKAPGDLSDDELDDALDFLYTRSVNQEKTQLIQLQYVFEGLSSVAYKSCLPCTKEDFPIDKSEYLKTIVREYFQNDYPKDIELKVNTDTTNDDVITNDIYGMINMYPDNNFTGRTLARIFHGIQSPNYPALIWSRCKYWRAHSKCDFNRIVQLANSVIVKMRS